MTLATSDGLRARYFANKFINLLRTELHFDEAESEALRACLADLAAEWRDADVIDKPPGRLHFATRLRLPHGSDAIRTPKRAALSRDRTERDRVAAPARFTRRTRPEAASTAYVGGLRRRRA